ncbi:NAD-dependent epimerase/dehydratase family protein [Thermoflexus sp.]|uniref:NAD-dependent epimerase/dehydratase family protein n=1 Tax=Thermoflexus sp. TaxID=1969742 RepID=UPI002ADE16CC|nr:NAD-dependent epimerase/dehydratase family protein [Thermoflexus sp.]
MRILITGGAGFIGSHVVELCIQSGHQVLVVDNLLQGQQENLPRDVPLVRIDIRDPAFSSIVADFRPEVIIHQAAQVDVAAAVADPIEDASVNIVGTLNVLQAAVRSGVRRVVVASSAAVYGEPRQLPVKEDHPLRPISPYGLSKMAVEAYTRWFGEKYGIEWVILRYGNVYGPRQRAVGEAGVLARFLAAMRNGCRPVIFGDGKQTRDFVHVFDVARANLFALTRGTCGIYNIGTGQEVSVLELYERLCQLLGYRGELAYGPRRPGDIQRMALAIERAMDELEWEPLISLSKGLEELVGQSDLERQGRGGS